MPSVPPTYLRKMVSQGSEKMIAPVWYTSVANCQSVDEKFFISISLLM